MTRNTLRRVEVAAPVYDPDLKLQIIEMFITMLSDNQKAKKKILKEIINVRKIRIHL